MERDRKVGNEAMIQAVKKAMDEELRAAEFFDTAMNRTADPGAKKMFKQLAAFQRQHFQTIDFVLQSIGGGELGEPTRARFRIIRPDTPPVDLNDAQIKTDIEALEVGIEAQKKRKTTYLELAFIATTPSVAAFFNELADEEQTHLEILEEQYLSISKSGKWAW
jgi:rubrerythrin